MNDFLPFPVFVKMICICFTFLPLKVLADADESSKVVDLGQMSVTGDVRRPTITWIDSQKTVREKLPSLVKEDYEIFEASLLQPEVAEGEWERGGK